MSDDRVKSWAGMTHSHLLRLGTDARQSPETRTAARTAARAITQANLVAAVADFSKATKVFAGLTDKLVEVTEKARVKPGGDAVGILAPLLQELGAIHTTVAAVPVDPPHAATTPTGGTGDGVEDGPPPPPAPTGPPPPPTGPPPGTANTSTKFSDIADELVATFDSAMIDPGKMKAIDRQCAMLLSHKSIYEEVGARLGNGIPWYFIGLLHMMESNCNFGTHLHNGDSLMHRTRRVPEGRPPGEVADPPFAWSTSAIDALTFEKFHTKRDWTLAHMLYRLEQYNGFGYRFRGLASPYLWSFSDRYIKGKFTKDRVFDPNSTSGQCGAAILLKQMIQSRMVSRS